MTHGSVLVVDDKPANVKLLSTRLRLLGYDVLEAHNGPQALRLALELHPDLVLSDVAMPGMDGLQLTRQLKQATQTTDIPIVLITAYSADETRLKGLESGADEFLNKPIRPAELEARVKSLVRLSRLQKELRRRSELVDSSHTMPTPEPAKGPVQVLVVSASPGTRSSLVDMLDASGHHCSTAKDFDEAEEQYARLHPDVVVVDLVDREPRLAALVSEFESKSDAVVIVTGPPELDLKLEALEQGATDYLSKPIITRELLAKIKTSLQRARTTVSQRRRLSTALTEAHRDALTGVFNRRFLAKDLAQRLDPRHADETTFSILMVDIDHFKQINDSFGHGVGDRVLKEVSEVLSSELRASDYVSRYGGEEFVVVLPGTGLREAATIAERLRERVSRRSTRDPDVPMATISIGVASRHGNDKTPEDLIKRADMALYDAKSRGRNRVVQAY